MSDYEEFQITLDSSLLEAIQELQALANEGKLDPVYWLDV